MILFSQNLSDNFVHIARPGQAECMVVMEGVEYEVEKEELLKVKEDTVEKAIDEATRQVQEKSTEEEKIDANVNTEQEPGLVEEPAKLAVPLNDETLGQQDTARGLECGECGSINTSNFQCGSINTSNFQTNSANFQTELRGSRPVKKSST